MIVGQKFRSGRDRQSKWGSMTQEERAEETKGGGQEKLR